MKNGMQPSFLQNLRMRTGIKTLYGSMNIRAKLWTILFVIISVVCLISLITLQITLNIYDEILYNESAQVLNLSSVSIENELKKIEKLSYNILSDSTMQGYFLSIKNGANSYDRFTAARLLTEKLFAYLTAERNVAHIMFIDTLGNQYPGSNYIVNLPDSFRKQIEVKTMEKDGANVFFVPYDNMPLIAAREVRSPQHLSLEHLGTLIILVNMDVLAKQCLNTSYRDDLNLMILSEDKTVYATNKLPVKSKVIPALNNTRGYSVIHLDNRKFFTTHITSEFTGWNYVNFLPYESVFNKIVLMRNVLLAVFLVLFLASILISARFAHNLTRPLEQLTLKMKKVETGDFTMEEESLSNDNRMDEIGCLHKDFNIMIGKINALIQENFIKQLAIKDAQYKALQAQINPHFLYNTLESVNCLAKINKQESISKMVESLGSLLRSSISNKENVVTVEEELRLLAYYINIQKIRYEERLDFQLDIAEDIKNRYIPKLTLQPIVENSIQYGLENMLDTCHIVIQSGETEEFLQITVTDNGPGIAREYLPQLLEGNVKSRGHGVGLANIDQRIKIMFGDPFGIVLRSEPGQGTEVSIRLPKSEVSEYVQTPAGR